MSDLQTYAIAVRKARRSVDEEAGRLKALKDSEKRLEEEIVSLVGEIGVLEKTSYVLTSIGEDRQTKAQDAIEALVTRGLQAIFDETLSFHILQDVKAKAATVEFVIRTTLPDRVFDTPVLEARGGGVAAVVGFLLRLVVMLLKKDPKQDRVLVLDETFAHVSDEYLPGLGEFLRTVVDKTGVQIVLVTHQPEFSEVADVVYRFSTKDGKTVVKKEK